MNRFYEGKLFEGFLENYHSLLNFSHNNVMKHFGYFLLIQKNENKILIEVFELLEADLRKTMNDRKKMMKSFTPQEIVNIILDICKGVQYLFLNKVIYTDIKPANIAIKEGKWKIIDIDSDLYECSLNRLIPANRIKFFTMEYAAPEIKQLMEKNEYHKDNIDISKAAAWSVGVIIYELIYGYKPPAGDKFLFGYFLQENWKKLISQVFIKDPEKRITLNEIIEHPFQKEISFDFEIENSVEPPNEFHNKKNSLAKLIMTQKETRNSIFFWKEFQKVDR